MERGAVLMKWNFFIAIWPVTLVSRRQREILLLLLGFLFAPTLVKAQPVYPTHLSLELRIATAESVVRGRIIKQTRTIIIPPGGFVTNVQYQGGREVRYASESPDGRVRYVSTVKVKEVIKGSPRKTVDVLYETWAGDKSPERWAEHQTSFLWFLGDKIQDNRATNGLPYWNTIRLGKPIPNEPNFGAGRPVYSMDLECLESHEEILARARKYARRGGGSLKRHTFHFVPGTVGELIVPVEPSLEKLARRMILRPQDFVSPKTERAKMQRTLALLGDGEYRESMTRWFHSEEYQRSLPTRVRSLQLDLRAEGVSALRYFKSRPNIKLVKPFLNDSTESYPTIHTGDRIGTTVRQYPYRSMAWHILKDWGVEVPQPVLEEPDSTDDRTLWADGWDPENKPCSIAVDRSGSLYVSDARHSIIRKLSPAGTNWVVRAIFGEGISDHMPRRENHGSCGIAVDDSGNVYVADTFRSIIRKLTPAGTNWMTVTIAGRAGHEGSADGTNGAARFYEPHGIATDKSGNVYVADTFNFTVRKLAPAGTNWVATTIAGDASKRGASLSTNFATRMYYPRGLAVDGAGNVYVGNSGDNTIRKIAPVGADWAISPIGGLRCPAGMAIDVHGSIYVADSSDSIIRKVTPSATNWIVRTIAGAPAGSEETKRNFVDGTNSTARFYLPQGVALDNDDNIYVADTWNSAVRKLTPHGTNWIVTTIVGPPAKHR